MIFALLCDTIGLKFSHHLFIYSEVQTITSWHVFSHILYQQHVFTNWTNFDWCIGLYNSFVISKSDNTGFDFLTFIWTLLYAYLVINTLWRMHSKLELSLATTGAAHSITQKFTYTCSWWFLSLLIHDHVSTSPWTLLTVVHS